MTTINMIQDKECVDLSTIHSFFCGIQKTPMRAYSRGALVKISYEVGAIRGGGLVEGGLSNGFTVNLWSSLGS